MKKQTQTSLLNEENISGNTLQNSMNRKEYIRMKWAGIIVQVSFLFLMSILTIGIITYYTQYAFSDSSVKTHTEYVADQISEEVIMSVREYPAYEWLLHYWYTHSGEMDIEYDSDYKKGTETEEKSRMLREHAPGLQIKYAETEEIEALPEEDQKFYAEIVYSWLNTRVNQIKRAYKVDYLFCVLTDNTYTEQFFLFSAADPDSVRGINYEEVYPLGTTVTVAKSQEDAMRNAMQNDKYLADAGNYVDYYAYLCTIDGRDAFIGMTYDLSALSRDIEKQTLQETVIAIFHQFCLAIICLLLIYRFVLRPLKTVQKNIRLYKNTKDSGPVIENLSEIRYHNEIGQLSEDVISLTKEMDDYTDEIEKITAERERIGTELLVAARIQESMLPNVFPAFPERKEFEIFASMDPAKEVGGDFYDFFFIDDDHLCLEIADVSGKGVPAALFMMASKIILTNYAKMGHSPAEILQYTNAAICSNNRVEMFVTVWLGILELSTGRLRASNAGHEYPILAQGDGKFELIKDRHGFVIGGMEGVKYTEYELMLEPGAKLFVYTDGLTEATDSKGKMFGTERILKTLNENPDISPVQSLEKMKEAVDLFVKEAEQFDDLTMMCLQYNGPEEAESGQVRITVEAKTENVDVITDFVNAELDEMSCPVKIRRQIGIVIDEIFSNIVNYAYKQGVGSTTVCVSKEEDPSAVVITFIDEGIPYDPTEHADPDVSLPASEREIGGLGIFIVQKLMDSVSYQYRDSCNILRIKKNLGWKPQIPKIQKPGKKSQKLDSDRKPQK